MSKLCKLLERRHETLVVVSSTSSVDENDIIALLSRMAYGVLCDGSSILAITLLVEFNAATLTGCLLL